MWNRTLHRTSVIALSTFVLMVSAGCGSRNDLPPAIVVPLPDGTETQVTLGAGVVSLANTSWQFFRGSSAQGTPFVTIRFGAEGNLTSFEDNTIASEILGSTILFDGERHDTAQPALTYTAATYGAETSDATGFAFVGLLNVFAPVIGRVASGTASASGTFDPDDPDIMNGTFSYTFEIDVSFPGVASDSQEDEFTFIARRVMEE